MFSKEELIEQSKSYFEANDKINVIFATTDGNFFYEHAVSFANGHASGKKNIKVIRITRTDIEGESEQQLEEMTIKELKKLAEERNIELTKKIKADIIEEIIEALKN